MPKYRPPRPAQVLLAVEKILGDFARAKEEEAAQLLAGLAEHIDFGKVLSSLGAGRPDKFEAHFTHQVDILAHALLTAGGIKAPRVAFLFTQHSFVESHLRELLHAFEGRKGCEVKARWCVRALLAHFVDGKPIAVLPEESQSLRAPSQVLNTQEKLVGMFEALHDLHAGRPSKYLRVMRELTKYALSLPRP